MLCLLRDNGSVVDKYVRYVLPPNRWCYHRVLCCECFRGARRSEVSPPSSYKRSKFGVDQTSWYHRHRSHSVVVLSVDFRGAHGAKNLFVYSCIGDPILYGNYYYHGNRVYLVYGLRYLPSATRLPRTAHFFFFIFLSVRYTRRRMVCMMRWPCACSVPLFRRCFVCLI